MSTEKPIRVLVLEEFRLHAADLDGAAARIVAESPRGIEIAIPLLTSVDDRRDVATLRALHAGESTESGSAQHAALDRLVSSWGAPKHYSPRITERSESPPTSYRLAVTEFGINTRGAPPVRLGDERVDGATKRSVGLLWIGAPLGSSAGLLILLGNYDNDAGRVEDAGLGWPQPSGSDFGVRIYENSRA